MMPRGDHWLMRGLSNVLYHQGAGLSSSGIRALRRSPMHYHATRNVPDDIPSRTSPAMFAGTLAHCAILEPDDFDKRYVIAPPLNKNSKAYDEWVKALPAGVDAISQGQKDTAYRQAASLRKLDDVADLLAEGEPEVSAFWHDPATRVLCKCRPDWVAPIRNGAASILLDVKTTTNAGAAEFARSCAAYGYHIQAAFYSEGYALASGVPVESFVFAVVESDYPYAAACYVIDEGGMQKGREAVRSALAIYADCLMRDEWPGLSSGVQEIILPSWA